jgi:hypothetical protein
MIEYTAVNIDDGLEAVVAKIDRGYSVTLRDTDADETMPVALIFANVEDAIAKADEIAAIPSGNTIEVTL